MREIASKISGRDMEPQRKVGPNTAAALEARFWQVLLEKLDAVDTLKYSDKATINRARSFEDQIESPDDRSYEMAYMMVPGLLIVDFLSNNYHSQRLAYQIAFE